VRDGEEDGASLGELLGKGMISTKLFPSSISPSCIVTSIRLSTVVSLSKRSGFVSVILSKSLKSKNNGRFL